MRVHEPDQLRDEERRRPEPVAAMPPHALLALQRSAGNQAVGRVLARDILGKQARGKLTAKYRGNALPASADDMLLEIYNTLRSKCKNPRVPVAWTSVAAAAAELKKQGIMDDADETGFTEAAAVAFGGEKKLVDHGPAMLEALKKMVAEKRPSIDAKHKHHIFQGDFKSDDPTDPTGYHSKKGSTASTTHEAYGTQTPSPTRRKASTSRACAGRRHRRRRRRTGRRSSPTRRPRTTSSTRSPASTAPRPRRPRCNIR